MSILCFAVQVFAASVTCTALKTKSGLSYCMTLSVGTGTIALTGSTIQQVIDSISNQANAGLSTADATTQNILKKFIIIQI